MHFRLMLIGIVFLMFFAIAILNLLMFHVDMGRTVASSLRPTKETDVNVTPQGNYLDILAASNTQNDAVSNNLEKIAKVSISDPTTATASASTVTAAKTDSALGGAPWATSANGTIATAAIATRRENATDSTDSTDSGPVALAA